MFSIEKSKRYYGKCTPNVLPCRVNHNGAVDASKRYWNPMTKPDGKTVAYFRGRKLHGKQLKVPKGYRGLVISSTDRVLPKQAAAPDPTEEEEEDDEKEPEVKVMEEQSEFEDIMVWGHEALPDDTADPYVRGIEEWITFAEQIHSYTPEAKLEDDKKE